MEISCFLEQVRVWAMQQKAISAVILVGSHARGEARVDSDVDLILITTDTEAYLQSSFPEEFGAVVRVEKEDWGRVTSIRAWYAEEKLEVEFGLTTPVWLERPLDEGTRRVLSDGYRIIIDKEDCFKDLDLDG